ncbi:MAG: hypothetical protein ACI93T_001583 [Porticoccaceae bacterium]|jgi:hypothetical protein
MPGTATIGFRKRFGFKTSIKPEASADSFRIRHRICAIRGFGDKLSIAVIRFEERGYSLPEKSVQR